MIFIPMNYIKFLDWVSIKVVSIYKAASESSESEVATS